MKAVMYGAGNIGRGFIGPLFSQAGYRVTFVDISDSLVRALHTRRSYPLRIVSDQAFEDLEVTGVDAVNAADRQAVCSAVAQADIMAISVGVAALPLAAPGIAAALCRRFQTTDRPLNLLICENMMDADRILADLLQQHMTAAERAALDRHVGLVETSIGRMVPLQDSDMRGEDPLRICVERYGFLPVDRDAFKGEIPAIPMMVPFSPFGFYLKRKLYLHNMGHAICAYLGLYWGHKFIYQAIDDPQILLIVKNAMYESLEALSAEYGIPIPELLRHVDDLLLRFANPALRDTCARAGRDTRRKLQPEDRLAGAAALCAKGGVPPAYIAVGLGAALHRYLLESNQLQSLENAGQALRELSRIELQTDLARHVLSVYTLFQQGANPKLVRMAAEEWKRGYLTEII